ncbi:hypothetical protein AAB100_003451 [Escherichia coli]|uniref:hypothetical protein n=1 Tax=Salmonella enterica TaxID=28901 RepID=UPI0018400E27|nr:hypothetical protein [Salmonella enterica]MDI7764041.1 hypothetical protein [Salmonella enterica]HAH1300110.1 hypothetical protein [Escherichia coli]
MQIVIHVPQRVNEESVPGHNRLSRNIDERRPILPCQQRMKSFKAIDIIFTDQVPHKLYLPNLFVINIIPYWLFTQITWHAETGDSFKTEPVHFKWWNPAN